MKYPFFGIGPLAEPLDAEIVQWRTSRTLLSGALLAIVIFACLLAPTAFSQSLESRLNARSLEQLVQQSLTQGDAVRGAVVFHQANVGCAKCHSVDDRRDESLGPNLAKLITAQPHDDRHVVQSILDPSAMIRDGYQTMSVLRTNGTVVAGLLISQTDEAVVVRDVATGQPIRIGSHDIDDAVLSKTSVMPGGIINTFASEQSFFDLVRYVLEIRDGGTQRARELQPSPELIQFRLPDYESKVDHAGLIRSLDKDSFSRGKDIYDRLCVNCHGTVDQPGSLPTAMRFAQGNFRVGGDPFSMYHTLTHGFGLMVPQTWMVPRQKYDVVHYIREAYVKPHNPKQYEEITETYLESLPKGDTFGPEPIESKPWSDMDYGPWMFNTVEVGNDGTNIAYKGLSVRLDRGPGGVARGNQWVVFDHDTMRLAGAWTHDPKSPARFIDWRGIHFDGRHQAHPRVAGDIVLANPTGPGWANPENNSFADDARVIGRDGKRYGPLPQSWAKYHGAYQKGGRIAVAYRIGPTEILESFDTLNQQADSPAFVRLLQIQPGQKNLIVSIATDTTAGATVRVIDSNSVAFNNDSNRPARPETAAEVISKESTGRFDGSGWLQTNDDSAALDTFGDDFTITARVRTKSDGVIFARTSDAPNWVPDGTVLFIRGGRLCYDVGWVGVVQSDKRIADNRWHDIAMVWNKDAQRVRFFVDNKPAGEGKLSPRKSIERPIVRIGYGAANFPKETGFNGQLADVRFYRKAFSAGEIQQPATNDSALIARWISDDDTGPKLELQRDATAIEPNSNRLVAGMAGDTDGCEFSSQDGRLCLSIPGLQHVRRLAIWTARQADGDVSSDLASANQLSQRNQLAAELLDNEDWCQEITDQDKPLWPNELTTNITVSPADASTDSSGFAVDVLTAPESNPWLARLRFSGLDFFPGGDAMAISTWDGDVYHVTGLRGGDQAKEDPKSPAILRWRRIASGLFQPLGVKIVDETIYVTCRDQLVILRDRNQDGSIDFYECFNNDHQVTEHFHEFAMGLQRDDQGNFYYAKSARHALTALVPHHGTLLKVTPDGSRTDILATGFRAANGVCLNHDGSFIVTDQEGHWNPKNRINWVHEGGFYGNMYGYHDVTDESNDAMEQPLCWITNAFDRSPAELLWVDSPKWGNLNGVLLNLSYGYGKVYTVPHQHLADGRVQGGMCVLPIPQFPTGTMRGRFNPADGQLYVCGLFAWGSSQQAKEGGLYRIRYTGQDATMPVDTQASGDKLSVIFSDPIKLESATDLTRYQLKTWSLRRTKNYGSDHHDETQQTITDVEVSPDGRRVTLTVPDLKPTWCYELKCDIDPASGGPPTQRVIHGTLHEL
ncbi:DUF6797 domain-containing protein [Stieleria varia]|uniref:Cytochrome c n=1 Tax=Stieleria varia TaxID=2528005 RepID=A0A5C6B067_9BACT|nr:DUF6797 domain-containing protein [Stieleria varia]TWU05685.1 Cytochrome c [Stieleria varia]